MSNAPRCAAIIATLLYTGARVEECQRIDLDDVAITARTSRITLRGKGDEVQGVPRPVVARQRLSDWIGFRANESGPLWTGQRGRLPSGPRVPLRAAEPVRRVVRRGRNN